MQLPGAPNAAMLFRMARSHIVSIIRTIHWMVGWRAT
jgi:hypothetical protein